MGPTSRSASPPPVLMIGLGWDRSGGLNRYFRGLREGLERAGIASTSLVLGPAAGAPPSVRVVADEDDPLHRRLWRYARAARDEAPRTGVVDVHFALFAWWPVRWGALRSQPLVVHFHGPWAQESAAAGRSAPLAQWVKRYVEGGVYRRAQALVVLSEAFKRLLVGDYDVAPWSISTVPPGVDTERFTPDRDGARKRLQLGQEQIVFTARRLVPRMGLEVLLQAWRTVVADGSGRSLVIAGEGPSRLELERQISDQGLTDTVRLVGRISDEELIDRYRAADLCVLPSLALEGFGLAAAESLACGTPVLVTDVGGLPEVVQGLAPDLVVPAGDADALAVRMLAALRGEVPSRGRCRAHAETFSWDTAAAAHDEIYRRAAASAADGAPRRRPRVVYLDHCAELSGGEIALARLLAALPDVDAHVILGEDGPLVAVLREAGVSVEVRPLSTVARTVRRDDVRAGRLPLRAGVDTARHVVALAWHLRRLRPDLLHTNSLKAGLYGSAAGRLVGVPVLWHARDRVAEDYLPATAVRVVRAVARRVPAAVLANSQTTLATLRLPERQQRSAHVVADVYLPPTPPVRPQRRGLLVGMVGRLAPWKGQHVFLEALAQVEAVDVRAVIVGSAMFGEDEYEARLRRQVDDLGLSDRVTLVGFRRDVPAELATMDVLVHASVLPEPFGQVVVEAMAAGVPVIASGAGGPAEIIEHGVDGLLHPPGDVCALADQLRSLLGDAALRARLGAAGRRRVEQFRPEVVGPLVMAAYRQVLAAR